MALETHDGSCHCGKVTFTARVDLDKTVTCNCSRCQRLGVVLSQCRAEDFQLTSGAEVLADYRFNSGRIGHRFCRECGIQTHGEGTAPGGTATVMVNVNCLHDVDPRKLQPYHYDGASA